MTCAADFLSLDRAQLLAALSAGHAIEPGEIEDCVYRGVSLGMPGWVDRVAWKTFAKVFHRDPERQVIRGWNLRIEQTGLEGPLVAKQKRGAPFAFGHFQVVPCSGYKIPAPITRGLMLDYGLGGNPPLDPTGRVRDPIVAVEPGRSDLLLGWTYLDLGLTRVRTPSFFTLERVGPLDEPIEPPYSAP